MMLRLSIIVQSVLAIAILYLGFAIHGFTEKVGEVVDKYPQMVTDISNITDKLEIKEWLLFAEHVEAIAPQILVAVNDVNKTLVEVNQTVDSVDKKIPAIVSEFTAYRENTIPSALAEMKHYRVDVVPAAVNELKKYRIDVIPPALLESKAYRSTVIPNVLTESNNLRSDIPPMLAKADEIIDKTQQIAAEATQGAVKGVVLSPINLLRGAGDEIRSKVTLDSLE
ncbi:hypothetical protein ACP43V_01015 [Vibrio genomosp. F10 str. 9ZC157]|uniref:Uncharacterized protein n=1 Tax=Vibrio genomosp. F10 str. ZF-129 TaxID=1187848 RepID=A0A1E5BHV6_9VIBR|nr:hypothetical protein [Vibrio genomosp. F10]OEE36652.1 hypothetical protein A1QO_18855 [Vibrio genomosp. F10 str. ZF-129]OEE98328.1 hypothetical protein A1QM_12340 [Vibrio genomosp. F10 str. 9ZC157]OEF08113.1 hypothetical protein A1QK_06620 [Vibrio genomosp. F10 str. 9ZD137]